MTTLGELGEVFDGPHATPSRVATGPYFLNISSLNSGRLNLDVSDHVSEEDFAEWTRRVTPQEGDLLFSYETRLGEAALMPSNLRACLGRRMALIRPDTTKVLPRFLLYLYLSPGFQRLIEQRTIHGATVNRIALREMPQWRISLPPLPEQQAIAEVLGALDDKIAANTRLAATADALVRTEYAGLAANARTRVPLRRIAENVRRSVDPADAEGAYVGLEHLPRRNMWIGAHGDARDVSSTKSHFQKGDTLFGKLRPYFHKVVSAPLEGVCSTDVLVLRASDPAYAELVLGAASSDEAILHATAMSEGTRMPRAKWKELGELSVPDPASREAVEFVAHARSIREAAESSVRENRTLAATRDALLPHLMSGKVRVRDADEIVEGITG